MISVQEGPLDFDDVMVRVNKIMDTVMQKSYFKFRPCERWQPSINFYETEKVFFICVDLSGVKASEMELHVDGDVLRITGQREDPSPAGVGQAVIHIMEIDHGPFSRSMHIPSDVETTNIRARQDNGLMWIELPRRAARGR